MLSEVGKLHGRVLIERVWAGIECAIGEDQCGFSSNVCITPRLLSVGWVEVCMGQVFAVRKVCEKYLENGKDVLSAFLDLEKAYDTIDRHGMWQMLRVHGVRGKLFKAVQSFYLESRACVQLEIM